MKIIFGVMSGLFVGFAVMFDMPVLFSGAVVSALASIDCIINEEN